MKQVTLNIGLNNNPEQIEDIVDRIEASNVCYGYLEFYVAQSTWEGEAEPTLVVTLVTAHKRLSSILTWVENLCTTLDQDAISCKVDNVGYLVYDYRIDTEGQPALPFDEKYFIQ